MQVTDNNILYLDDEVENLKAFELLFQSDYKVHTAQYLSQANNILDNNEIKVVISDLKMPEISGIDFISQVKDKYPDIVCMIITGYADKRILLDVINKLDLFWLLEKPWNKSELKLAINNAMDKYDSLKKANECSRLKQLFLANISHEIRTPLNGIVGFASLIEQAEDKNSISNDYFNILTESAYKLIGIVDDIIMASRIQAGSIQIVSNEIYLNDLLEELYRKFLPIAKEKQIELKVIKRIGLKKIPITTDKEKLSNIFSHLLNNSLKYTKEGCIEFGIHDEEQFILFVKDAGKGIIETDKPIIYDHFKQGKQKYLGAENDGIGIGLSIVKGLIELLNGKIWFESQEDIGTTFYIQIPNLLNKSKCNSSETIRKDKEKLSPTAKF